MFPKKFCLDSLCETLSLCVQSSGIIKTVKTVLGWNYTLLTVSNERAARR